MRFIYSKAFAYFVGFLVVAALLSVMEIQGFSGPVKGLFLNAPRPVVAAARSVVQPLRSFFTTIYQLRNIARENGQLTNRVFELQQQLVAYDQARLENEALKKELGFVLPARQAYIPCSVLAENPLGLTDTIIVNCGSESGVKDGQAVVSQGYLVGKIIYVTAGSATVLLVTNSKFTTDARISKTGATGVVKGSYGSGMLLDQLSQNDIVEKEQLVVTAGINEQIPKSLLIGEVGEVISVQNDLFKKATLISPIDFSNLQFVFVVK